MNPGLYNERITIVEIISNDDHQGGGKVSTSDMITLWASVIPFSSSQTLAYNQLYESQGYNIECRSLKTVNVTTSQGILYDDKLLTIHSCILDGTSKLKIIAFER